MLESYHDWVSYHTRFERGEKEAIFKELQSKEVTGIDDSIYTLLKARSCMLYGEHKNALTLLLAKTSEFKIEPNNLHGILYSIILSEAYFRNDNFQKALIILNSIKALLKQSKFSEAEQVLMYSCIRRLEAYILLRQQGKASFQLLQKNITLHDKPFYPPIYKFMDYHILTFTYMSKGFFKDAQTTIKHELRLIEDMNFLLTKPATLHMQGIITLIHGDPEQAMQVFQEALELSERIKNNELIGNSLEHLGEVYVALKEYDIAISFFKKALSHLKFHPNSVYTLRSFLQLLQLHLLVNRKHEAKKILKELQQFAEESQSKLIQAGYELALIKYDSTFPRFTYKAKALERIHKLLSLENMVSEIKLEAYFMKCKIILWELQNFKEQSNEQLTEFINAFEEFLVYARNQDNVIMIINAYLLKAELFLVLQDQKSARSHILQAMDLASERGLNQLLVEITMNYSHVLSQNQEYHGDHTTVKELTHNLSSEKPQKGESKMQFTNKTDLNEIRKIIYEINDFVLLNPKNYALIRIEFQENKLTEKDLISFLLTITDAFYSNAKAGIEYQKIKYNNFIVYITRIQEYLGIMIVKNDYLIFNYLKDVFWEYVENRFPKEKLENVEEFLLDETDITDFENAIQSFIKEYLNLSPSDVLWNINNLSMLQNVKIKSLEDVNQDLKYYKQLLNPTRLILLKLFYDLKHVPIRLVKKRLNITWGSLHTYLKPFQEDGLIIVKKGFVNDQVQTIVTITEKGILAYENLRNVLNNMFFN